MPDAPLVPRLLVACATSDLTWVDSDVGAARHLLLVDLSPTRKLSLVVDAPPEGDDPLAARLAALAGVGVLFTTRLPEDWSLRLAAAGIFPVEVERPRRVDEILDQLRRLMVADPPLWLCRVLRYQPPRDDHPWSTPDAGA